MGNTVPYEQITTPSSETTAVETHIVTTEETQVNTDFVYRFLGKATENPLVSSAEELDKLSVNPSTPIAYDLQKRLLTLAKNSINAEHFSRDIDLSGCGFNADKVDGRHVDDSQTGSTVLWTAEKIINYIVETYINMKNK